ncbi:MAG: HD-GYP domain-containing protein, partial [Spirochaetia bacterium]
MIATLETNYAQLEETRKAEEQARMDAVEREEETLYLLGRVSEFRDAETGEHLKRIGELSARFARLLGWSEREQERIRKSAPLHDVGKVGIPDALLLKPGKLDPDEYEQMKRHAAEGYELLRTTHSEYLIEGARIARTHHEKWDGTGYPEGLAGEDIPLCGRIVGLLDVFDALTSSRPYKEPWPPERALQVILEQRGKHFDPHLVDLFESHFAEFRAIAENH